MTDVAQAEAPAESLEIVALAGRLDVVTAHELRSTLSAHIKAGRNRLIVDLSEVDFVDSSGLAALVQGRKLARRDNGDLRLVRPLRAEAMRVFRLTTFDQVFEMGDSVEAMAYRWASQ